MLCVTLWSGAGLADAWEHGRAALAAIRPHAVQLHGAPSLLKAQAPAVAAQARAALPGVRVWLGVAGDAGQTLVPSGRLSVAALHARRVGVAATARACGADTIVLNCEKAWRRDAPGFTAVDAGRWVRDLRAACGPGVAVEHTAYVTRFADYPWAAFLGPGLCERTWPQAYWAAGGSAKWMRATIWRRYWERDVPGGAVAAPYLQAHGCATADLTWFADQFADACFWAVPARHDAAGLLALRALAEVERRGFAGAGRVAAFQRSVGLQPDARVGPLTLRALGLQPAV